MPIKFGDLIENANAEYAVIDLTDNQARGVAFVDDFGGLTGDISSVINNAVSVDKRKQGMLLVNKDTAEVFLLEGAPGNPATGYNDTEFGTVPGAAGSKWKAVGSLELQNTNIDVNISSDKSFGKYTPSFSQTVGGTEYTGVVPVAAWMSEVADGNPAPIASSQGATSLEIIRDALNETFPLEPSIIASNPIVFNQPSGSVDLTVLCNNVNETTMTSFVIQFRELGGGGAFTTLTTLNTASIVNGNDATASSFSGTFTHNWSGQDNQFNDFDGFEYKVIATDAAGAVGEDTVNKERNNYVMPLIANFNVSRQKANTLYNGVTSADASGDVNESDTLRVIGNIDSTVSFQVQASGSNHSSISGASHTYRLLRKVHAEGSSTAWAQIDSGSFQPTAGTAFDITVQDSGLQSLSVKANKIQYCVLILDAYTQGHLGLTNSQMLNGNAEYDFNLSFNIPGSSGSGVNKSFSGNLSGATYPGHVSDQIRFVTPQFVGYIPESVTELDFEALEVGDLDDALMQKIIDFQFGTTDFTDVRDNGDAPSIGNPSSPYLLTNNFPITGNSNGVSGSYSLGTITNTGDGRPYMIFAKQTEGQDRISPNVFDNGTSGLTNFSGSTASFHPGIGAGQADGEIFCNNNTTNQNQSFQVAAAPSNSITIVGRTDASGAPVAGRTVTIPYHILLANNSGAVSNVLRVSTT